MPTVAEQAYQKLQDALADAGSLFPAEVKQNLTETSTTINKGQAQLGPAKPLLDVIDSVKSDMKKMADEVRTALAGPEGAAMTEADRADYRKGLGVLDAFVAYLDAERAETIAVTEGAAGAKNDAWYASWWFIVICSVLAYLLVFLIV